MDMMFSQPTFRVSNPVKIKIKKRQPSIANPSFIQGNAFDLQDKNPAYPVHPVKKIAELLQKFVEIRVHSWLIFFLTKIHFALFVCAFAVNNYQNQRKIEYKYL